MDLTFIKQQETGQDPVWVAEFEATSEFNLHIEGVYEGNVKIFQKGVQSGEYARSHGATPNSPSGRVYDYDLAALVYPKYIKVECATEPSLGVVTFK